MSEGKKVALITGASSGIGEAAALEFAKLGYNVVITGRNDARLESVANKLTQECKDSNVLSLKVEMSDEQQVDTVVAKTVDHFGRIDVLVNNAGTLGHETQIQEPDFYDDFKNIMQVNLFAPVRLSQLALPHLEKTKGVIVNISSIADSFAIHTVSYSVSKAGLSMLSRTLVNALEGNGVRVVTISPGPIATNIVPEMESAAAITALNRIGQPKEVADLIVFAATDKGSFIHGANLCIDGGMLPKFGGFSQFVKAMQAANKAAASKSA